MSSGHLVVLGCSARKIQAPNPLPAIHVYNGPSYQVLNTFLRDYYWPENLSLAILSAEHGLIGGLATITDYDRRMDRSRATELKNETTTKLEQLVRDHRSTSLVLGSDYLDAIDLEKIRKIRNRDTEIVEGQIGEKLHQLHRLLRKFDRRERLRFDPAATVRPLYFLPDWDDTLDADFNFVRDKFSHEDIGERRQLHCNIVMKPKRMCDGILISLAQFHETRGIFRTHPLQDFNNLAPYSVRDDYGLQDDQILFGDCGAFSYVNESKPAITSREALRLYHLYDFDFGASIDHIPVTDVVTRTGNTRKLSLSERQDRLRITRENAAEFIELHRQHRFTFTPVGVIQGIEIEDYVDALSEYLAMGYSHVAIGGLVPRNDEDIRAIVEAVSRKRKELYKTHRKPIWIHLFGIFRPELQKVIRQCGINSFDSATYFRKAWLRSGQNYLGKDKNWYAAIRVPMTSDARTLKRLSESGVKLYVLERREKRALSVLRAFNRGKAGLDTVLEALRDYDSLLERDSEGNDALEKAYRRTLESRIWEKCKCPICKDIGIDVVIFRGYNRNKRRGAHNTLMLYESVNNPSL